jgi:PAS domain S-box-containing protein
VNAYGSSRLWTNNWARYAVAVAITALALLLRWLLDPLLGDEAPYITVFAALVYVSTFVGLGPTVLSFVIGLLGVTYWFASPRGSFAVWATRQHLWATAVYVVVSALIMTVGETARRGRLRVADSEQRLATVAEELRHFLAAVPIGLTRCSRELRYVSVNPAYAQIAGLPPESIVNRDIPGVMGPDGWREIQPYVEQVLRGERVEYEASVAFSAGRQRTLHVVYTPESDDAGTVTGWVASVADVTEFKRVETDLRKFEKLAAAGQLAATIAHEINNPLSTIGNVLYLFKAKLRLDSETTSLLAMADNELARVSRIIQQSLSYYRTSAAPKEVDVGAIVKQSLLVFAAKMEAARIELMTRIAPDTSIMGHASEIRQLIDNLLLNAIQAMPAGGRLGVSVRASQNWTDGQPVVRLTIADSGSGIPRENLASIFEPFFTTKSEKGTGLGLWVVRGIVARHGGRIRIRSAHGGKLSGTTISVMWPAMSQSRPGDKPLPSAA